MRTLYLMFHTFGSSIIHLDLVDRKQHQFQTNVARTLSKPSFLSSDLVPVVMLNTS